MISHLSRPYPTIDVFLYSVLWDSGEISKHYYNELDPIGNCKTIGDYEQILMNGKNAKAVVGPQGGFKNFEITVCFNNTDYQIKLNSEQKNNWHWLKEFLERNNIPFEIEKLAKKKRF